MKNILILVLSVGIAYVFIHYLFLALKIEFNAGLLGGTVGAIIGGRINSYLNKKKQ